MGIFEDISCSSSKAFSLYNCRVAKHLSEKLLYICLTRRDGMLLPCLKFWPVCNDIGRMLYGY